MPRKPRWYDAVPEATVVVVCGGEKHRVTWRRGKMVLHDHDLTAERAMLAFGGELCECMRVLEMWVEQFRMPPELFGQMHTWLGDNAYLVPTELALPRRLGMVLTWERSWRFESWLPTKHAQLLAAEVKEKALGPLRQHVNVWKAKTGARVVSGCDVALVRGTAPTTVEGSTDGVAMRAFAHLHGRWVVDVWPRGIATVDDAFVLDVLDAASVDDMHVLATRWEPATGGKWATVDRQAHLARGTEGTWRVSWDEG